MEGEGRKALGHSWRKEGGQRRLSQVRRKEKKNVSLPTLLLWDPTPTPRWLSPPWGRGMG